MLDGAEHVFQTDGYAATTTNKIAARAGVSIGSLYQYFPDKDAILAALAERHMNQMKEILVGVFKTLDRDTPDLPRTISQIVDAVADAHLIAPGLHRLLFEQSPRTPEAIEALAELEMSIARAVVRQLERLGVAGDQPLVRALLLVQGLEAQVHGALIGMSQASDPGVVRSEICELWIRALREEASAMLR